MPRGTSQGARWEADGRNDGRALRAARRSCQSRLRRTPAPTTASARTSLAACGTCGSHDKRVPGTAICQPPRHRACVCARARPFVRAPACVRAHACACAPCAFACACAPRVPARALPPAAARALSPMLFSAAQRPPPDQSARVNAITNAEPLPNSPAGAVTRAARQSFRGQYLGAPLRASCPFPTLAVTIPPPAAAALLPLPRGAPSRAAPSPHARAAALCACVCLRVCVCVCICARTLARARASACKYRPTRGPRGSTLFHANGETPLELPLLGRQRGTRGGGHLGDHVCKTHITCMKKRTSHV